MPIQNRHQNKAGAKNANNRNNKGKFIEKNKKEPNKQNWQIYKKNIDFLTIQIFEKNKTTQQIQNLVDNSAVLYLEFWFCVRLHWLIAGGRQKKADIIDKNHNTIASVYINQPTEKKDRNFATRIEFVGWFFTAYSDFLGYFIELFEVDHNKQWIIKRVDYAFDLIGATVHGITANHQTKKKLTKYEQARQYKDMDEMVGYAMKGNRRHELVVYDKKNDILDKKKHRMENNYGNNPYLEYINEHNPITRVEYRIKSQAILELKNNSLVFFINNIENLARSYIDQTLNIQLPFEKHVPFLDTFTEISDPVSEQKKERSWKWYKERVDPYIREMLLIRWEEAVFELLLEILGEKFKRWYYKTTSPLLKVAKNLFNN